MERIQFREIVELFLNTTIYQIKSQTEVPNINFKFEEDAILLFKNIIEKPFIKYGSWTPNARQEDINFVFSHNDDCPTIYVKDSIKFFKYLEDITNELIILRESYGIKTSSRNLAMQIMRRIWLRMGITDIQNIDFFLDNQLQFVKNRTFDIHHLEKIGSFNEYDIFMNTIINNTWDETTRSMVFIINGNNKTYELPHILYDIDNNGTCYIYGVQSFKARKDKTIERNLYKLNKNIENPNVHPSKLYALMLFTAQLKNKGISKIIVPSMQILSYRYHELLSEKAKKDLNEIKKQTEEFPDDDYFQKKFQSIKEWYDKVYNKQDKISYLKTEELINLVYRIIEHNKDLEITNEINIQGDSLNIKIK
ncbi:MAG: hypothetical protein IJ068_03915 [Bacilli bacterium]|nr:hypothetical protein [Bacilli bacterium]